MFDNTSLVIMYAVTPCHAGCESALGVIDNPIQRERHTNWPVIQASGMKGAFRANFELYGGSIPPSDSSKQVDIKKLTDSVFGSDKGGKDDAGFAGSSVFCDARILAYPMRSDISPFVWITCPAVLRRFVRDLDIAGKLQKSEVVLLIEAIKKLSADLKNTTEQEANADAAVAVQGISSGKIQLEDCEVSASKSDDLQTALLPLFTRYLKEAERLLLVPDRVFNYGVSYCTQVAAQIKIDSKTGTTKDGSLRYQEELPSDTIMYSVIHWGASRDGSELQAETIKKFITEQVIADHIQIAGDETLGRGIFALTWGEE